MTLFDAGGKLINLETIEWVIDRGKVDPKGFIEGGIELHLNSGRVIVVEIPAQLKALRAALKEKTIG